VRDGEVESFRDDDDATTERDQSLEGWNSDPIGLFQWSNDRPHEEVCPDLRFMLVRIGTRE
jgi:hypothetical protein